jgi:hypothetical protein
MQQTTSQCWLFVLYNILIDSLKLPGLKIKTHTCIHTHASTYT